VDATKLRRAIARTRLAPVAAFPKRLVRVARHDSKMLKVSARWLVTSREHHNYTYDLTWLSHSHLAWFVSVVCDIPIKQVRTYLREIEADEPCAGIEQATRRPRDAAGRPAGPLRPPGRLVRDRRATRPAHVVEP
jgi:hypothetical protein